MWKNIQSYISVNFFSSYQVTKTVPLKLNFGNFNGTIIFHHFWQKKNSRMKIQLGRKIVKTVKIEIIVFSTRGRPKKHVLLNPIKSKDGQKLPKKIIHNLHKMFRNFREKLINNFSMEISNKKFQKLSHKFYSFPIYFRSIFL